MHCIPDGSTPRDDSDPDNYRKWPGDDGINILGTLLGSPAFIESYMFGKGAKHMMLLLFIQEVVAAGLPREAMAMLTGAASQKLIYLLKTVQRNPQTAGDGRCPYFYMLTLPYGLDRSGKCDRPPR